MLKCDTITVRRCDLIRQPTEIIGGKTMKQKEKTQTSVIRRELRSDGENNYVYELCVSENKNLASYRIPLYSVHVYMTDSEGQTTSAAAKEAFADAGKAILFYEKVVRALATPIDLVYVLEDEMS